MQNHEINVKAQAAKQTSSPICIHALNPSQDGSIQIYGNAVLEADDCAVMANSNNSAAIMLWGKKSHATAEMFGITGGYSGINITPEPKTDVEPVIDIYASLPVPKSGPCAPVGPKLAKVKMELEPGTYCGGLTISPGSEITLKPGVHIFKDGLLSIGANSKLYGKEVTIAFVGYNSYLYTNSGTEISLTSPVSGPYANIQFISDRVMKGGWKSEEWATLSDTKLDFDGLMYLPEQDIWLKGGTEVTAKSPNMIMIADQIWLQDSSRIDAKRIDARGLNLPLAIVRFKHSARLIQ